LCNYEKEPTVLKNRMDDMDSRTKAEKFWDRAATSYDKEEKKDEKTYRLILEKLHGHLHSTDVVLDYGCGTGLISNEIAGSVGTVRGIDLSSKMVEMAKIKAKKQGLSNTEYVHETVFSDRLEFGSFDVILSFHILHLLNDPASVISRLHRLLKPKGLLLSVTPCMGEKPVLNTLFSLLGSLGVMPKIQSFKRHDLEQMLASTGFGRVESEKLNGTSNQYFTVARK